MATGVQLTGVTRRYGSVAAADNVDLTVAAGEFVALVGPSGCGKSTLLRLIAGLDRADAGTITIDERDVCGVGPAHRDVAMVFQNYALYPHLTVRQNIATPLRMRRLQRWERIPYLWRLSAASRQRRKAIDADIEDAASLLGIASMLDRKPAALSGGQRQRVALGRAMVRQPAVFLYDEPLSNLDAELRASMRTELIELHRRLGVASIYVTHDQVEAMTMADRIAVMRDGRILQIGTPADLYSEPAVLEVAQTIGVPRIGLLAAKVSAPGEAVFVAGEFATPIAVRRPAGSDVRLGLRAEHLRLVDRGGADALPARVIHVEHLGSDTLVHVAIEIGQGAGKARLIVRTGGASEASSGVRLGEPVGVAADPARILAFDDTGHRINVEVLAGATNRRADHG